MFRPSLRLVKSLSIGKQQLTNQAVQRVTVPSTLSQRRSVQSQVNTNMKYQSITNMNHQQYERSTPKQQQQQQQQQQHGEHQQTTKLTKFYGLATIVVGGIAFSYYLLSEEESIVAHAEEAHATESSTRKKRSKVIFILGPPGSGKRTISTRMAEELGYVHLSIVDLLREEMANKTELATKISEAAASQNTFPAPLIVELLEQAMEKHENKKFVIEAFPRNDDTLFQWEATLAHKSLLQLVLLLDVEDNNTSRERLLKRGRPEDSWEYVQQRMDAFDNAVLPIAKYYYYMAEYPFVRVVTDHKSVDDVWNEVKGSLEKVGVIDTTPANQRKPAIVISGKN